MARTLHLVLAALLLAGVAPALAKKHHDDDDDDASSSDVLSWVVQFATLPTPVQQFTLAAAGASLQQQMGLSCNPFGGIAACQAVPADSAYAQQCGVQAEQQVDCLTQGQASRNVQESIVDDLNTYLTTHAPSLSQASCPQCYDRLREFWCALAVPPCGTFTKQLGAGLLPVLSQVVLTYAGSGSASRADALAASLPELLNVAQAGLPCQEMCEAVVNTCGCFRAQETMGSLLTFLAERPELAGRAADALPRARTLFKKVWDTPFCQLFPSAATAPGLVGRCNAPSFAECSDVSGWCGLTSGSAATPAVSKYIQSLLLVQYLRATTGWVVGDDGMLWGMHDNVKAATKEAVADPDAAAAAASRHSADIKQQPTTAPASGGLSGGQIAGISALAVFGAALMVVGGISGVKWYRERRERESYMQLTQAEEFTSLMGNEAGRAPWANA